MSRGLVTNELAFRDVEHYENWQRRFLAFGVQVEIRAKNSRYSIFTLLHLCFVFYGEIYIKNGLGKISAQPHTIVKQIWLPSGNVLFLLLFSLSKNWMHNVGWGCAEILPCKFPFHRDCKDRGYRRDRRAGQTEQKMNKFMVIWFKGKGEMMTRGMDFRKPRLGEYMAPFELVFMPVSTRGFTLFTQQDIGQESSGKGLNCITNDAFLLSKYDGNYNW